MSYNNEGIITEITVKEDQMDAGSILVFIEAGPPKTTRPFTDH